MQTGFTFALPSTWRDFSMPGFHKTTVSFETTRSFERLPINYLAANQTLHSFYRTAPVEKNARQWLEYRKKFPVDREVLVTVLRDQYASLESGTVPEVVWENISSLSKENMFTVTTGHQLNLFTGPLYFLYKIITTLNLAERLTADGIPTVPVYWMATEDHDMAEIAFANVYSQRIDWPTTWKGMAGRAPLDGIELALDQLRTKIGTTPGAPELFAILESAYLQSKTLAEAMRKLVNSLFGKYGLVILDADDARFKKAFVPVMLDDVREHSAEKIVGQAIEELKQEYTVQVHPRSINLFYAGSEFRERIVKEGSDYKVMNMEILWSEETLCKEIKDHPERFSPNVVLRPLYQETVLPNLAYIGGPAEIAYWLEYKSLFDHYHVHFPVLFLRNCALIIDKASEERCLKFGIEDEKIFDSADEWVKNFIRRMPDDDFSIVKYSNAIDHELGLLSERVARVDPSLRSTVESERQRVRNALQSIDEKVLRSKKKKSETEVNQLQKLKEKLFPGGTQQERFDNFIPFYLRYGTEFIRFLKEEFDPFEKKYILLKEKE